MDYERYTVSKHHKQPLLDFIVAALSRSGCRILKVSDAKTAPFRITFEDTCGGRHGIIVYAFFANSKETKNRPSDEHRFQIKYGKKDDLLHQIWQDPFQIYTTLVIGIDPERDIFVAIDPIMHELTKFFISIEFKKGEVEAILDQGWHCWERTKRAGNDSPVETMVVGRPEAFFDFVRFEQAARGLDQGHRFLLAEKLSDFIDGGPASIVRASTKAPSGRMHQLAKEFEISEVEILGMIEAAPRLKMAVRGWVAEHHLQKALSLTPGVDRCSPIEEDGA